MATVFCRPTATGSNNGTTWENGYTSLQAAHDACGAGDHVWMTEGVYAHTVPLDFDNANNPNMYGGFPASLTGTNGSTAGRTAGARTTLNGANSYQGVVIDGWIGTIDGFKFLDMFSATPGAAIVHSHNTGDLYIRNCEFNSCSTSSYAGALFLYQSGIVRIFDTVFKDNTAVSVGGAIRTYDNPLYMYRCYFDGNHSGNDGGAVNLKSQWNFSQNCVFVNNSADAGGAVYIETATTYVSTSCTYADNTCLEANRGGAVLSMSTHTSVNSIFWGNTANGVANQLGGANTVTYSVVEGSWAGIGNKTGNPQFVGTGDNPYALTSPTSSAIDAGDSGASMYAATDYLGQARYDDLNVTNTGAGSVAYADIGAYEYTPPPPPASVPGLKKFLYAGEHGRAREQDPTDDIQLGGLEMSGDIDMNSNKITALAFSTVAGDIISYGQTGTELSGLTVTTSALDMSSQQITNVADGTVSHHAVNLAQLEQTVITGGTFKELLAVERQTNNAQGVLAASIMYMTAQPVAGDTITLTNGTSTRTFGATSGGNVQYTIGATVTDTMQNLSDAIEADGTAWVSDVNANLDAINGAVIVTIPFDNTAGVSKVYGTWATQANCQVVDYTDEVGYSKKTSSTLPTVSPPSSNFGFRRLQAALAPGELHYVEDSDVIQAWDDDANVWTYMSGSGGILNATSASGGGTKGKITADSDYGLAISAGILSIDLATNRGLGFSSGELEIKENTAAGLEVTSSGLGIDLAATNPALSFDGSGDLQILADTTAGIETTANGVAIDLAATPGLEFDGSGDLQAAVVAAGGVERAAGGLQIKIDDTPDTLDVDADGLKVVGLPSLFKVNSIASSANVTATNLGTLTGGGVTTLHTHTGSDQVLSVANSFTAGENVTIGDPVYFDATNNQVAKADAGSDTKYESIGVAKATVTSGNPVEVVATGPAAVLTGATAGTRYYLGDAGGLTTTVPAGQKWVVVVGFAVNATTLFVMPKVVHKQFA